MNDRQPGSALMGASNVMAAYAKYAGKVPPLSMQLLVYMALVSVDADRQPWYGQGHHALAEHALGRPTPITEADVRAVERGLAPLAKIGAIRTDRKAAVRRDGPNTARYRLFLDPSEAVHAPRNPSDVPAPPAPSASITTEQEDPPRPTVSGAHVPRNPDSRPTVCGSHVPRNPWDRGVRGTTKSEKTDEEVDDLRTDLAVARASDAAHKHDSPTSQPPTKARCSHGLPAGLRPDGTALCGACRALAARGLPLEPTPEPEPDPPRPGGQPPTAVDAGTRSGPPGAAPAHERGHRPQLRLIRGAA